MNKKQLLVTTILVFLMGVMVFMQQFFETNIQKVALVNNNIEDMLEYTALDGNLVFSLPDNWTTKVSEPEDYIVYNNNFVSEAMGVVGSIQVLSTKTSIEELINIDKKNFEAEKVNNIKTVDEKLRDVVVKKLKYEEKTESGRNYMTQAYYFPLDDELKLKITFSAGLDRYKENYETVYRLILESFKKAK
ncbi:PsbP-related protein [uncultured Clostridium sp.]|jgi:hypothetical protein|uniref:PsbP-related protein n=1 Tax=uncultured Clostridium sp. TaxID=59620 RepID=UPI00262E0116|nr:PsbP-related protein [uncultured Clostridium sp.]